MSILEYQQALKKGKKEYRARMLNGLNPTLEVLDHILPKKGSYSEVPLGLLQIPLDMIVGTVTEGRSTSFAANFMPILNENSEFAIKWASLSNSHEQEGIRDAVKVYEYLNQFYVLEGNKRVSVLRYYDAVEAAADVIRIVPKKTEENKVYYEFLDFYEKTQLYGVTFQKTGSYQKLLKAVKGSSDIVWDDEDRKTFVSVYAIFGREFSSLYEENDRCVIADAFLALLSIYSYEELTEKTPDQMKTLVKKAREEICMVKDNAEDRKVEVKAEPGAEKKTSFLSKVLPGGMQKVKAAFIYEKTAETSSWTYMHELGRLHLDQAFSGEVSSVFYENTTQENISAVIEDAVQKKCNIIFTTSPVFAAASVKAAIAHPNVKILNCSLNTSHRYIRTYYIRVHEAKFLMGILAGILAGNDTICYLEDYPIYGSVASINAFAIGVGMVNPRAKIHLGWTSQKDFNLDDLIDTIQPSVISGEDILARQGDSRLHGIYQIKDGKLQNMAMPLLQWGRFYEQLIRGIMDGNWKDDDNTPTMKAINYWWGMSADVLDVVYSKKLSPKTKRLSESLKEMIRQKAFYPFAGALFSQEGQITEEDMAELSIEDVMKMDWLADNIIGSIPSSDLLRESAKPVVQQQGIAEN